MELIDTFVGRLGICEYCGEILVRDYILSDIEDYDPYQAPCWSCSHLTSMASWGMLVDPNDHSDCPAFVRRRWVGPHGEFVKEKPTQFFTLLLKHLPNIELHVSVEILHQKDLPTIMVDTHLFGTRCIN